MTKYIIHKDDELAHYGVPGTKWGIRRYQNPDGSYKPGAEGRYYTPVKGTVGKSKSGSGAASGNGGSKTLVKGKLASALNKTSEGGGGGSKATEKPINKTVNGKDIKIYSNDEKLDTSKDANKKKSSSSSAKDEQKTEEEFKVSQLLDKIENYFDVDDMTDEDWEDMDLDDSDIKEIDELISKYREWRNKNKSKTKKTKKIDTFIERYESWKSSHNKHSEPREEWLMHHGILGMKWGIRRYQKSDGTLTEAGKERYSEGGSTNRHETTWYQKAKDRNNGSNHHSGHTKQRVSKNTKDLADNIAYRDSQRYNERNNFSKEFTKQQHELSKKYDYAPQDTYGWKARSENDIRQFETRIARNKISEKNNVASIQKLLETEVEEVDETLLEKARDKAEEILDDISDKTSDIYNDASKEVKELFQKIFRKK